MGAFVFVRNANDRQSLINMKSEGETAQDALRNSSDVSQTLKFIIPLLCHKSHYVELLIQTRWSFPLQLLSNHDRKNICNLNTTMMIFRQFVIRVLMNRRRTMPPQPWNRPTSRGIDQRTGEKIDAPAAPGPRPCSLEP